MAFAQFTYRESLRDIETCLGAVGGKLYHMGFRTSVARSTLADANESRDWRIYADFAQTLISTARNLYARDPLAVDLVPTGKVLRVKVSTVAGDAFLKFLVGQMLDQLGKHGAAGVHAAILAAPVRCFQTPFAGAFNPRFLFTNPKSFGMSRLPRSPLDHR